MTFKSYKINVNIEEEYSGRADRILTFYLIVEK